MENFIFKNPTKLIFGKGMIARLPKEIPAGSKIMVTFGGGSVKKNGVYEQVTEALRGYDYTEFWGIEPNPKVETLRKAVEICKEENIDFLLAVGGGSVLDGTKLIAAGALYDGDPWEIVVKGKAQKGLPFASVMTLPATGSEMNSGAVISRGETHEKYAFYGAFPVFSILDPETTYSLPKEQIANALADIYVHVIEQYLTIPGQSRVMDRWSEGILQTVIEIAPKIRENQHDYDTMCDFMLSATLALNNMIAMGVTQDWATHMIGHELTAIKGVTHGQSLVLVLPSLMKVMAAPKKAKILQYGERVFGIKDGTDDEKVAAAIDKTREFFHSIGLHTKLSEAGIGGETIDEIERRFRERGTMLGENNNIDAAVVRKILEEAM